MTFANTGTLKTRMHSLFLLSHSLKCKDILVSIVDPTVSWTAAAARCPQPAPHFATTQSLRAASNLTYAAVTRVQSLAANFSSTAYVHRFPLHAASDPSLSAELSGAAGVLLQDFPPILYYCKWKQKVETRLELDYTLSKIEITRLISEECFCAMHEIIM